MVHEEELKTESLGIVREVNGTQLATMEGAGVRPIAAYQVDGTGCKRGSDGRWVCTGGVQNRDARRSTSGE